MRAIIFEVAKEKGPIDGSFPFQYSESVADLVVSILGRDIAQLDGVSTEEVGGLARTAMLLTLDRVGREGSSTGLSQAGYLFYEICYLCCASPRATFYVRDVAWWYPNP